MSFVKNITSACHRQILKENGDKKQTNCIFKQNKSLRDKMSPVEGKLGFLGPYCYGVHGG